MLGKPRRRWFRFSLRTMFVVATLVCLWLGWELSVVRQRRALRQELAGNAAFNFVTADAMAVQVMVAPMGGVPVASVPRVRRWLGDEAIDQIWYLRHYEGFSESALKRIEATFPEAEVYESLPEPCHPGCFPRGTLVDTPEGRRAIEAIRAGDVVTTIAADGAASTAAVEAVFETTNQLWQIETEAGALLTTSTQPLCASDGRLVTADALRAGDLLRARVSGSVLEVEVISAAASDRTERVFNVVLGDAQHFVAGGFVVRSKPPAER